MSGSLLVSKRNGSPIIGGEKPWDFLAFEIGRTSPLRDEDPAVTRGTPDCNKGRRLPRSGTRAPPRSGVTRLKRESMCLYGQFPNSEAFHAAICHMCGMTVKCSATHRHLMEYHSATVDPILPPPPPAPTVKLKSLFKNKVKKEPIVPVEVEVPVPPAPTPLPPPPPPPSVTPPLPPPITTLPEPAAPPISVPTILLTHQEMTYFPEMEVTGPKCSAQSGVKVSVDDNDLPVVSIQDNTDLPLTDDIIEIMNSEGIQSIDIPEEATAAWKNLMQDFGAIQEMAIQNPALLTDGITTHELYDANGTPVRVTGTTYTLGSQDGTLQYTQPITLPQTISVDNQQMTEFTVRPPQQCAPVKPKLKTVKAAKTKFQVREYDPNKHCGVVSGESQKPCTRSLTCKAHTLSLRRLVEGRVKSFDTLLAEHRAAKQAALAGQTVSASRVVLPNQSGVAGQITLVEQSNQPAVVNQPNLIIQNNISGQSNLSSRSPLNRVNTAGSQSSAMTPVNRVTVTNQMNILDNRVNIVNQPPLVCDQTATVVGLTPPIVISTPLDVGAFGTLSPDQRVTDFYNSVLEAAASCPEPPVEEPPPPCLPEPRPGDICWYPSMPRPLASCTFSASHMGNALLLGKRFATVRNNFKTALMQPHSKSASGNYYNFNQNSLGSISKNMHVNSSNKSGLPEVRKLIVTYPGLASSSVKTESSMYYGSRQNGHLFSSKKPLMDDDYDIDTKRLRTPGSVDVSSVRNKVTKHLNQTDLMDLDFMFDPLMADEKC